MVLQKYSFNYKTSKIYISWYFGYGDTDLYTDNSLLWYLKATAVIYRQKKHWCTKRCIAYTGLCILQMHLLWKPSFLFVDSDWLVQIDTIAPVPVKQRGQMQWTEIPVN